MTAKTVEGSEFGSWGSRSQYVGDIERVEFNVDVELKGISRAAGDSYVINNQVVTFSGNNIADAWNKCPDHSGLDFVTDLDGNMVKVILEGQKLIDGRDFDEDIDDGAYAFTIAPVDPEVESISIPSTESVYNSGQDITFPELTFVKGGEYQYVITEKPLDEDGPEDIEIDETKIYVTIEIPDSLDDASIAYTDEDGNPLFEDEEGYFTFTNTFTGEIEPTLSPEPNPKPKPKPVVKPESPATSGPAMAATSDTTPATMLIVCIGLASIATIATATAIRRNRVKEAASRR